MQILRCGRCSCGHRSIVNYHKKGFFDADMVKKVGREDRLCFESFESRRAGRKAVRQGLLIHDLAKKNLPCRCNRVARCVWAVRGR